MGKEILGDMFDLDRDGNLDCFEQAAELSFLTEMIREDDKVCEYDPLDHDNDDEEGLY